MYIKQIQYADYGDVALYNQQSPHIDSFGPYICVYNLSIFVHHSYPEICGEQIWQ